MQKAHFTFNKVCLALSEKRDTFVVANPERFETLCDFFFQCFFSG